MKVIVPLICLASLGAFLLWWLFVDPDDGSQDNNYYD